MNFYGVGGGGDVIMDICWNFMEELYVWYENMVYGFGLFFIVFSVIN